MPNIFSSLKGNLDGYRLVEKSIKGKERGIRCEAYKPSDGGETGSKRVRAKEEIAARNSWVPLRAEWINLLQQLLFRYGISSLNPPLLTREP